ncbi:hypothetical protein ES705_50450 [subsurface metagenome]|nr:MAG: hypothetical protein ES695_02210 [Candidatus Atribacteria bacterium 1244-E10-H5-B2]
MADRADDIEKEKRIYQVGLLLSRKPNKIICQLTSQKWGISTRQVRRYIKLAKREWEKYFTDIKRCGMAYHIAKRREVRDKAMEDKNYRLVLDVDKDEAELLGLYIKKIEEGPPGSFAEWVKAVKEEEERRRKKNSDSNR